MSLKPINGIHQNAKTRKEIPEIMFTSVKNKMKRDKLIRLLGFLVQAATVVPEGATAPVGFALIPEKDAKELIAAEPTFVSVNPNGFGAGVAVNADGKVQAAALAAGITAYQASQTPAAGAAAAPAGSAPAGTEASAGAASTGTEFAISSDIPLPAINRGGGAVRESKYPFAKLEIGQSFFVAGTTTKGFGSTINGQNRKFSKTAPKRKFTLRAVTEGGVAGVRVGRIAVDETPAAPAGQPAAQAAAAGAPWPVTPATPAQ